MPNGGGWAEEPSTMLEAITALEIEQREIEYEAMPHPDKKDK